MGDNHNAVDAEQRHAPILRVFETASHVAEGVPQNEPRQTVLELAFDDAPDTGEGELQKSLARLHENVPRKAIGDNDIDAAGRDVLPLNVATKLSGVFFSFS